MKRSVTIRPGLYRWVQEQIGKGKFQNFSHVVEISVEKLRNSERDGKK